MNTLYTFTTKSGLLIRVRRIQPDDTPYLVEIFEHMSAESRYRRFHQTLDDPSPSRVWTEAERIAHADPTIQGGLIAFADLPGEGDVPIGGARYVYIGDKKAEAAVSVRDDVQRMGIGTKLLQLVAEEAQAAGIEKLVASVLNDNKPIWQVLHRIGFPFTSKPEGAYSEVEIDLTAPVASPVNSDTAGANSVI